MDDDLIDIGLKILVLTMVLPILLRIVLIALMLIELFLGFGGSLPGLLAHHS